MSERRSPEMFPWASSSTEMPQDSGAAPHISADDADRRSLDLPNFNPPVVSTPASKADRPQPQIPQYSPPVPPQSTSIHRPTMGDIQAQRLSANLRQRQPVTPSTSTNHPIRPPINASGDRPANRAKTHRSSQPIGRRRSKQRPQYRPLQRQNHQRQNHQRQNHRRLTSPFEHFLNRLDHLFRGKVLLWIFGAWAVFWFVGSFALMGLLSAGSSSISPNSFTDGTRSRIPLSQPQPLRKSGKAESLPNTAPIIKR